MANRSPVSALRLVASCLLPVLLLAVPARGLSPVPSPRLDDSRSEAAPPADLAARFEAVPGGPNGPTRFAARGIGYGLLVAGDEFVMAASRPAGGARVRVGVVGASPDVRVSGEDLQPGRNNYIRGDDPAAWRTGVAAYGRVRCSGVYPGVDFVCYGTGRNLEYDVVVAPGADARAVRLRFDGASRLEVTPEGDLVATTAAGEVRHHAPHAFQVVDGARVAVAARYAVSGGELHFELGAYDTSRPLVVDPVLEFTKELGGGGYDWGVGVTVDAAGYVYLVGNTLSSDFPTVDPFQAGIGGGLYYEQDAVVVKLDPSGTQLLYSTYFGGSGLDDGTAIAVGSDGSVVIVGRTDSTDLPLQSPLQPALSPPPNQYVVPNDVFITKFTPDGSGLVFSTYLGGGGFDVARGVALDAAGNLYVTGSTKSGRPDPDGDEPPTTPFPTTPGAFSRQLLPSEDAGGFVSKLSPNGSALLYSTYLENAGVGIAVDADGNAYTAGHDALFVRTRVRKLNAAGSALVYAFAFDGRPAAIAIDGDRAAYVTGRTPSFVAPGTAPTGGYDREEQNLFVAKVNPAGSGLDYSLVLGDVRAVDNGTGIAVDAAHNAYVVGNSTSPGFPVEDPLPNAPARGAFVMKLDPAGAIVFSTFLGVDDFTQNNGVAATGAGDVYVVGQAHETNSYDVEVFAVKIAGGGSRADTVGVCSSEGAWFLRDSNTPGPADLTFSYGPAGVAWPPLAGDWNGDGVDTPGLFDPVNSAFFLRNACSPGPADLVVGFGPPGSQWQPVAGDWNGDGVDTIGLYDPGSGAFFLKNGNSPGGADVVFAYGPAGSGWRALSGDWDGDGRDSVGLYNPANGFFFLKNANAPGAADLVFGFGPSAATPLTGDWNGDGRDTIGVYLPSTGSWFLRDSNSAGAADTVFGYGPPGATPVVGYWEPE